jgi:uncharacterized membrane protein YbhN (UPF0104 family)
MGKKFKIQLIVGVLVTAAIVYFSVSTLKNLQISVVFQSKINWGIAAVSVAIYMYSNYIRGLAYTHGIDPGIDRMTAFEIIGIGHALNMVLPLHAGEGMRIAFFPSDYSALRRTKLLIITTFSDFIAVVIISIITVPLAHFTDPNLLRVLWILVFVCIGSIILFTALVFKVPRLRSYVDEFMNYALLKMLFWVFLSWLLLVMSMWLGLIAFGFSVMKSLPMALAVFVATNIINLIPASPGAIGLFEYGTILALGGLGIDRSTALSSSLLLHLLQYAALLPLGAFLYIRAMNGKYGHALRGIRHKRKIRNASVKKSQ